jgi:hypothetical protein
MIERTNILPCKLYTYARKHMMMPYRRPIDRSKNTCSKIKPTICLDGVPAGYGGYEQCASAVIDMGDDSVHNHAQPVRSIHRSASYLLASKAPTLSTA